jgi:HK97 family phage major capsid protein
MDILKQLLERRNSAWEHAKAFLDRADDNGDLSAEDAAAFEEANIEVSALDTRIKELHGIAEANKKADAYREDYEKFVAPDVRDAARKKEKNALARFIAGETGALEFDFSAIETHVDMKTGAFTMRPRADLGEDSASAGGDTVPTDFLNQLYQHMIENSAIRQTGARILRTANGNALELPKAGVYGTAALKGEGTALAEADPTFGKLTLNAWKYGQLLQISNELLADSGVDITGFIAQDLGRALGQVTGAAFVTGSGSNQPRGVMVAVAADAGTAVQVASATVESDNLIDLMYDVIPQYRQNGFWLMNDSTALAIRKLKNADDQYVWQPGIQVGQPDQILGRPVVVDPNVDSIGSANESIAFGDFSRGFIIREAGGVRIERSDDYAFNTDQATYRSVMRVDSDLIDANAIDVLDTD